MLDKRPFVIVLLLVVNILVILGSVFYPVSRDEFYYLNDIGVGFFKEYKNAYFEGNPRIGQFFANAVGRSNKFFEALFSVFLFNGLFAAVYLNVFRKLPSFSNTESIKKYLFICTVFIVLINYFGEMFWYVPFSTNYTLLNIFYLLYVFVIWEYFYYQNSLITKIPIFIFIIAGFFTGMGNEHVTPVLLMFTVFFVVRYLYANKKLPAAKMIAYSVSLFVGYLSLFFAPANSKKFKTVGAEELGFSLDGYIKGWISILKNLYYYNIELLIGSIIAVGLFFYLSRLKILGKDLSFKLFFFISLAITVLFVVAYSPLIGTRLLFFSLSMTICCIALILSAFIGNRKKSSLLNSSGLLLILVLAVFNIISYNASLNYQKVISEISKLNSNGSVQLESSFDYRSQWAGYLNGKVLLDDGTDYIDNQPEKDNFAESNLKKKFKLKSISAGNEN